MTLFVHPYDAALSPGTFFSVPVGLQSGTARPRSPSGCCPTCKLSGIGDPRMLPLKNHMVTENTSLPLSQRIILPLMRIFDATCAITLQLSRGSTAPLVTYLPINVYRLPRSLLRPQTIPSVCMLNMRLGPDCVPEC